MPEDLAALDELQQEYKEAVDEWIATIREEEALASVDHSDAEVDKWEAAGFVEDTARNRAKAAKKAYEEALREKFFNFQQSPVRLLLAVRWLLANRSSLFASRTAFFADR